MVQTSNLAQSYYETSNASDVKDIFFKQILAFVLSIYLLYQHRILAVAFFQIGNR